MSSVSQPFGPIQIQPIGFVRNRVQRGEREPLWRDLVSEVHLNADLAEGLHGIEQFSHLLVLFSLHLSAFERSRDT